MREERLSNLETDLDELKKKDDNAWDIDYRDLRSGNFEGSPQRVKDTSSDSQAQKAQDLVDAYTADITAGKSIHNTAIQSPTPNLNTQTATANAAVESNTFIDPEYSLNNSSEQAADAFLKTKKLEFGKGLQL